MKFAIYGDSYADGAYANLDLNQYAWTTILAEKMGATRCDYYAVAGSSFFYTYNKIMDTANGYDGIIVAVTEPMRYTQKIQNQIIPNIQHAKTLLSHSEFQRLQGWFVSLDTEFMNLAQELLVEHVQKLYPQALLIPCFPTSFTDKSTSWGDFSLKDITHKAAELCSQDPETLTEIHSKTGIICHIPSEWQAKVAELVYNCVKHGQRPFIDDWPLTEPGYNYFK